ncbi:MAG: hypothetical protein ACJA0U_000385 [Salibacteraceae bacterium]|jgi:hypothetical protein
MGFMGAGVAITFSLFANQQNEKFQIPEGKLSYNHQYLMLT